MPPNSSHSCYCIQAYTNILWYRALQKTTISQFGKQSHPYKEPSNMLQKSTIQAYNNPGNIISAAKQRLLHNHEIITLPSCEFLDVPHGAVGVFHSSGIVCHVTWLLAPMFQDSVVVLSSRVIYLVLLDYPPLKMEPLCCLQTSCINYQAMHYHTYKKIKTSIPSSRHINSILFVLILHPDTRKNWNNQHGLIKI